MPLSVALPLFAVLAALFITLFLIASRTSRRLREQAEEKEFLALYDPLTGLPNRNLFHDQAQHAIEQAKSLNANVGLMLIRINRFREVNNTLGYANGDRILQEFTGRLQALLPDKAGLARLGGVTFGVVFGPSDSGAAVGAAEQMVKALGEPFSVAKVEIEVHNSIGIATFPADGDHAARLLQQADTAMRFAEEHHDPYAVYSERCEQYSPHRLTLLIELQEAIPNGELRVQYQPKAELSTGSIVGAEALVRWRHPRLGELLPPDAFIPLAERTGLIHDLTLSVLDTALAQQRQWMASGHALSIAVNVSARDLRDGSFPQTIERLLLEHRVPPELLELELTESILLDNPEQARQVVTQLREMGVKVAIDDFGTGYSSFAYLKSLPISEIKIDRSFISTMRHNNEDAAIVESIIDLAHDLDLTVVAEGVETLETWTQLNTLGCDVVQGFYLGRAFVATEFETLLRDEPIWKLSLQRAKAALTSSSST